MIKLGGELGTTVNTGNFENVKVGVSMEKMFEDDKVEEGYAEIFGVLKEQLANRVVEVMEELKG